MSAIGSIVLALELLPAARKLPAERQLELLSFAPAELLVGPAATGCRARSRVVTIALGALLVDENAAGARLLVS